MTHTPCDAAAAVIDAVAMGEDVPAESATHIAGCPTCKARLHLARRIDTVLRTRAVAVPPESFTSAVLARVRQDRWRTEQVVDFGFNLAVAAGLLLIVGGLLGLAWQLGAFPGASQATALVADAMNLVARRAATDTRVLMMGMLLITTAIGVWWWAEEDVAW